jgi:hypothetical protein
MTSLIKPLLLGAVLALSLPPMQDAAAHTPRTPEQRMLQRAQIAKFRLARAAHRHPELAVAIDLRRLEMIYRRTGQEAEIVAMYQDLLKRSDHPKLRAFAERRLRHAERVAHPEQTIAELRARIDDKLSKLR